jgi:hypothetical protein
MLLIRIKSELCNRTLISAEEAIVVEFRRRTLLPLDDNPNQAMTA